MRGTDVHQEGLFSYLSPESRIPKRHPLRPVREMVISPERTEPVSLNRCTRTRDVARFRRRSCCGHCCCRSCIRIRSERMLCEQLDYNLLFRWFIGLSMDDPVWDHSTFSKTGTAYWSRILRAGLFDAILAQAEARDLTSDEHFTVDGTLIEAWASLKSVRAKMARMTRLKEVGVIRSGISTGKSARTIRHESSTDPESRAVSQRSWQGGPILLYGSCADGEPPWAGGGW